MEDEASAYILCAPCSRLVEDGRKIAHAAPSFWRHRKYLTDKDLEIEEIPHHPHFRAFTSSAAGGCRICVLLLSQLTPEEQRQMLPYEYSGVANLYHYNKNNEENQPPYEIRVNYFMPRELYANRTNAKRYMKLQLWPTQGWRRPFLSMKSY